jgi:uncharacterized protein DUF4332
MKLDRHRELRAALAGDALPDPETLKSLTVAIADPPGDHLSARVRYNLACYFADSDDSAAAYAQLALIAADESLAVRAQSDPAFHALRKDGVRWAKVFGGPRELADIAAIGPSYAAKLSVYKIRSPSGLLKETATARRRDDLAQKLGLPASLVLRWREAILLRSLEGIGTGGSNLLTDANIESVKGLAQWPSPDTLSSLLAAMNVVTHRLDVTPDSKLCMAWIESAKKYIAANRP